MRGVAVKDLCLKYGFSEASYYLWRSKCGGMSVSDAKRVKELEVENTRLKKRRSRRPLRSPAAISATGPEFEAPSGTSLQSASGQ
jgi:hypothetical protein